MTMGNSSPNPTSPAASTSSAAAASVQIEVGRYYHYKGRTGTGLNEETGDCLVSAQGSQPNTWNIKMLVSKRSYTGCPASLFSKPMMESSGRGRRPTSTSSSSSSSSSKSPGYSVTASGSSASVTSSQPSSLPSSQSSSLQKRKQPVSSPNRQLPAKKAVISSGGSAFVSSVTTVPTAPVASSNTHTGIGSSSASNKNTSSSSSSSYAPPAAVAPPKASNKPTKTAASAVPAVVKPAYTTTSKHSTNDKDVITRWPQINDEIQYSIVEITLDGHEILTGKWQPGVVSAVCRDKAQLTLMLHAIDYHDHDSGMSSAGTKGRSLTVDYPGKTYNHHPPSSHTHTQLFKP